MRFYQFALACVRGRGFGRSQPPSLKKRYTAHVQKSRDGDLTELDDFRVWTPHKTLLLLSLNFGADSDAPDVRKARAKYPLMEEAHRLYQVLKSAPAGQQVIYADAFQSGLVRGVDERREKREARVEKERAQDGRRLHAHRQLTKALLARTPDNELPQTVVDYADYKIGEDWEHDDQIVAGLPKPVRLVFAMQIVEAEVYRNGFGEIAQTVGWHWAPLAAEGYRLVGAKKRAAVTDRAIAVVAQEKAKRGTEAQHWSALSDESRKALSALDDGFYACDKTEDVYRLIARYIRQHPDRFVAK